MTLFVRFATAFSSSGRTLLIIVDRDDVDQNSGRAIVRHPKASLQGRPECPISGILRIVPPLQSPQGGDYLPINLPKSSLFINNLREKGLSMRTRIYAAALAVL